MKTKSPLFSIVMPTRNRGHLIRWALQSALEQAFDDYEIVVTNNSSEDDTDQVIREFSDDRIRYFCTDRVLGMPDSWEFALNKARGEWVTYLADDDAISSRLLSEVSNAIEDLPAEVVTWRSDSYWNDSAEPFRRNQYVAYPFSAKKYYVSSKDGLENLFAFRTDITNPRMLNSCCNRTVIDKVRKKLGRFFLPPAPDYTACAAILAVIDKLTFIDIPLLFSGTGEQNPAGSARSFIAFINELGNDNSEDHAPIKVTGPCNTVFESIFKMKNLLREELRDIPVNMDNYVKGYAVLMFEFENRGFDVDRERIELEKFLHAQPFSLRLKWRAEIAFAVGQHLLKNKFRETILKTPLLLRGAQALAQRKLVKGEDARFNDILGAVRHHDKNSLYFDGSTPWAKPSL